MDGYIAQYDEYRALSEALIPSTSVVSFENGDASGRFLNGDFVRNFDLEDLTLPLGDAYEQPMNISAYDEFSVSADMNARAISVEDMVKHAQSILGVNAHQVAKLVGVSRAALYKHLKDTSPRELDRYRKLYDVSLAVEARVPGGIKKGLKNVIVDGATLLDHLKRSLSDPDGIAQMAQEVDQKLQTVELAPAPSKKEARSRVHAISRQG
jgi:predicted DNA-binding transcriptional regulator AlpA